MGPMVVAGKADEDAGRGVDQCRGLFSLPWWRKEIFTGLWTDSVVAVSLGFVYSVLSQTTSQMMCLNFLFRKYGF